MNDHNIEIFKSKIESTDWSVGEESDINTSYDLFNNSHFLLDNNCHLNYVKEKNRLFKK